MTDVERNMIDEYAEKAAAQHRVARELSMTSNRTAEVIQAAQVCVELSLKGLLLLLGIESTKTRGWGQEELVNIMKQIDERNVSKRLDELDLGHIRVLRLLMLVDSWSELFRLSEYGIPEEYLETSYVPFPFEGCDVEHAVRHAEECLQAMNTLRFLEGQKLAAIRAGI